MPGTPIHGVESRRQLTSIVLALVLAATASAAPRPALSAAELALAIDRLSVLGSALYIAAHPDDENTAVLAYLAQGRLVRTGYLSLTRGGGGQNLLGSERGELLGLMRTQELLAARRIDGAEQMFSRARDFGYSKSPGETLAIWDREAILADVVWAIRRFRPDVIITRFPTDASTHGHHTASALLATEAFRAAADADRFPEQLTSASTWQARRLLWNAWKPHLEQREVDTGALLELDIGGFNPILGQSYGEIAALSRSMHKCQGFGSAARRGALVETFELLAGEPLPAASADLFAGIDVSWSRVDGTAEIAALLARAGREFDPRTPSAILPLLIDVLARIDRLPRQPWIERKRAELHDVIRQLAGLWVEAIADRHAVAPGGELEISTTILKRSTYPVSVESIDYDDGREASTERRQLVDNIPLIDVRSLVLPGDTPLSQPYWLQEPWSDGMYTVREPTLRGLPESPGPMVKVTLRVGGQDGVLLEIDEAVAFRWTDPVAGERYRDLEIVPQVSVRLDESVYVFANGEPRPLSITVKSSVGREEGTLRLRLPAGYTAEPTVIPFVLTESGATMTGRFVVTPPKHSGVARVAAEAVTTRGVFDRDLARVDYPHIPIQTVFAPAEAILTRVDIGPTDKDIGYVMGAGDDVPQALRQAGYRVTLLEDGDIAGDELSRFDAIVVGVRAFNTRPSLAQLNDRLFAYAEGGGVLIVQYAATRGLESDRLGPFPFELSHDRVTDETAEVRIVAKSHPLVRVPNVLGPSDFEGWVQERGLYFAGAWDDRYETVFESNDVDEEATRGGLLFARHGAGSYIYTGYAWFRQLPAGVPGAYRIFANLLAGGMTKQVLVQ